MSEARTVSDWAKEAPYDGRRIFFYLTRHLWSGEIQEVKYDSRTTVLSFPQLLQLRHSMLKAIKEKEDSVSVWCQTYSTEG